MASDKNHANFVLPDLSSLSETERLQVLAVMRKAQEFDEEEEKVSVRKPMEGQLYKYTNVMKGWQYRWFVLDPDSGMLEYFEKEEHKKQRPRASVHLAASVISPSDEDSQTFTVNAANGEVYKLRASDAKERQYWVDRLRRTSEYHTATMAQKAPPICQKNSSPERKNTLRKDVRSGSAESITTVARSQHKAPPAHLITVDPFREVKEYIVEAEDYAEHVEERIQELPQTGHYINRLDNDLLLLRATKNATLQSLNQCLCLLQQRQQILSNTANPYSFPVSEWKLDSPPKLRALPPLEIPNRSHSVQSAPSPADSYSSAVSPPFEVTDSTVEGPINHDDEIEETKEESEAELDGVEEHKSIILHLLSQLKLGMDLTKVVLPTFILERRSLLEMFADCMAHPDIFLEISSLPDPESRMLKVVEWYLTSFHAGRQGSVAKKPYNPIIGETFHCSWSLPKQCESGENCSQNTNSENHTQLVYCAEQVSHHPPISAFYFECPSRQVCVNASIWTKSKFYGMSIGVVMVGKVSVKLLEHDEEYTFGLPSAYARSILTVPWVELGGKITIMCQKTNYCANVIFHTKPFYGGKLHRVTGEVKNNNTGNIICKVNGEWNSTIEFTYANGESKVIDVNKDLIIAKKRVRPIHLQSDFESRRLWKNVTDALASNDVSTATEHKRFLESRQREGEKYRKETNTEFPTKYFHKEGDGWVYNSLLKKGQTKGTV